jgi:hypothetical protein
MIHMTLNHDNRTTDITRDQKYNDTKTRHDPFESQWPLQYTVAKPETIFRTDDVTFINFLFCEKVPKNINRYNYCVTVLIINNRVNTKKNTNQSQSSVSHAWPHFQRSRLIKWPALRNFSPHRMIPTSSSLIYWTEGRTVIQCNFYF